MAGWGPPWQRWVPRDRRVPLAGRVPEVDGCPTAGKGPPGWEGSPRSPQISCASPQPLGDSRGQALATSQVTGAPLLRVFIVSRAQVPHPGPSPTPCLSFPTQGCCWHTGFTNPGRGSGCPARSRCVPGSGRPNLEWEQWEGPGLALCPMALGTGLCAWSCCSSLCPCLCVPVSLCLCVLASVHPCIRLSLYLYIHTSVCPCVHVSICPCIHVSVHPGVCMSVHPHGCVLEHPCVHAQHVSACPCICACRSTCPCVLAAVHPCTCASVHPCILVSMHSCFSASLCPCDL